jgi:cell division protein FtsQ
MLKKLLFRSKFLSAALVITGLLAFGKVSIDQAAVEEIRVVGNLDDPQLMSVRARLNELDAVISDASAVKQAVNDLNWVNRVNVRKEWPAGISVEVFPEQIIAYWNDNGFISEQGQVVETDLLVGGDLPLLYGPVGTEFEVMLQYQQLNRMLNVYGHEIRMLKKSERGAWSIETRDRLQVLLGKEDLKARMHRFLTVINRLQDEEKRIVRMDARYINGVAVQFAKDGQLNLADITQSVGEQSL